MKKLYAVIIIALMLAGCSPAPSATGNQTGEFVPTPAPTVDSTLAVQMINECIDDYNNNLIKDREVEWSTTIPPLPIEIEHIEPIASLDQINDVQETSENDNAIYTGYYNLDRYNMVFKIYLSGNSFWLYGDVYFTINLDTVVDNDPQFADTKHTLDNLLTAEPNVIDWLYGVNLEVSTSESSNYPGYYLVTAMGNNHPKSIQEVKDYAEQVFPINFLDSFYSSAFEGSDAIYIEDNGNLYAYPSESNIYDGTPYDTSKIIAVKEDGDLLLIDILVTYGDETSDRVERIELIKTDNGYRLNNTY